MPEKAKALYSYVCSTVSCDFNNYCEETDWSTLYDALIRKSTVCIRCAVRKPWAFLASVAPACDKLPDPDRLRILPKEEP